MVRMGQDRNALASVPMDCYSPALIQNGRTEMMLIKKMLVVTLLVLLGLCALQFMAVNPQPVELKSVLGKLPTVTLGQAVLSSWLLGMVMGLMSMSLCYRWRKWLNSRSKSARMTPVNQK